MPAVSLQGVSKSYRIYPRHRHRLLEAATLGKFRRSRDFWALKDIDLEVERGTTLGVVGRNGAGKSTLLQVVSGVLRPTSGKVSVNGQLVMLQMGAGFNSEFTGRENVMLNGLILRIERRKMLERFDEIEDFADIGEFMDQPVKTYSSGMRARLGFAVAVNVDPEILIVDETLSVGDAVFRHMGLQKMRELRDRGTTILFVSHGLGMVKTFCSEGALLHEGRLLFHGDTAETIDRYRALVSGAGAQLDSEEPQDSQDYDMDDDEEAPEFRKSQEMGRRTASLRHGTGEARIVNVEMLDESGAPAEEVDPDSESTVRAHIEYLENVDGSIVGITLRNKAGLDVFSTSTKRERAPIGGRKGGERVVVDFTLKLPMQHGPYSVSAYVSPSRNKKAYLDWVDVATAFNISRPENRGSVPGLFYIPAHVRVHDPEQSS